MRGPAPVEALDLDAVRANLEAITARGFHRQQDLLAKLETLLARVGEAGRVP